MNEKIKNINKLMPHSYDLSKLEDVLRDREQIVSVLQPIQNIVISGNGAILKKSLNKLRELKARTPNSLVLNTKTFPAIRYEILKKIDSSNYGSLTDGLITANAIVSEEMFTFPQLMSKTKCNHDIMVELFKVFSSKVKKGYPKAKVGASLKPSEVKRFISACGTNKPDYVSIDSGIKTFAKTIDIEQAIDYANSESIEVFCINAHIFVAGYEYAASMQMKPITGFSINHGQPPIGAKPTYFNPKEAVPDSNDSHYWTAEQMIDKYGVNYDLKALCPCEECKLQTIKSWFEMENDKIIRANMRHKTLYVQKRMIFWQENKEQMTNIDKITKQLSQEVVLPSKAALLIKSATMASGVKAKELSEKSFLATLSKNKVKVSELKHTLRKEGYYFSTDRLVLLVRELLLENKLRFNNEAGEFCLSC